MFSDTWGIAPFSQEELEERTRFLAALSPFNIKRPEGPENQVDREATARNYARALLDSVRWGENGEDEVLFLPSTGSRKRIFRKAFDLFPCGFPLFLSLYWF